MHQLKKWTKPLRELLSGAEVPVHVELLAQQVYPYLIQWQEWPDLFLTELGGLFIPSHQRLMLRAAHRGALSNVNVSSRGTAKSATICALYDLYLGVMIPKRKIVMLSAVGFRGGQMMLSDMERFMTGGWDSQREMPYVAACVEQRPGQKTLVSRTNGWWQVAFESGSNISTYPTTDEQTIRGIRGHVLFIDEANTFDDDTLNRVVKPFLNVMGDFEHGGLHAVANAIYYTSTIDYTWRPFMRRVRAALEGIARDYDVYKNRKIGNFERAEVLERMGVHEHTYVSFDYTDILIPTRLRTRSGRVFRIKHPDPKLEPIHEPKGIPFTAKGPDGTFLLHGPPVDVYRTYPINKAHLEQDLLNGTEDEAMWLSEQRNVEDNATGDVYPYTLLQRVSCEREPLMPFAACSPAWQEQASYREFEIGYSPRVMYRCNDPVVIGLDYAGGDRDFCAFVVIRVGPLAAGSFNPLVGEGYTPWSNVIWCEQHRQLSHRKVADKLWQLIERYPNLAYQYDEVETDTWKLCRAIGLDMKGGGTGVRDALVFLDQETIPVGFRRILDPLDSDSRMQGYLKDRTHECWPILDAIHPSDMLNDRCVEFTLAQMKTQNLWLPKWVDASERQGERDTDVGYIGSRILKHQLQRIQQQPLKVYRTFFMPGSAETAEGKKDMFSAFLYAAKQLRAHIIRFQTSGIATSNPVAYRTAVGTKKDRRNHGAVGARPW
jgi:hypothetical protein